MVMELLLWLQLSSHNKNGVYLSCFATWRIFFFSFFFFAKKEFEELLMVICVSLIVITVEDEVYGQEKVLQTDSRS